MAQSGYTPILIYGSGTATNVPLAANLTSNSSGVELALNYADGKLFYKDSGGVVQVLATKGSAVVGGSNTQVQYNSSGALAGSANMTFDGTTLSVAGLNNTGNTTLGDASTDTVTVNGYMGVGGAPTSTAGLYATNSALTSVSQVGIYSAPTGTSAATSIIAGYAAAPTTAATAFTVTDLIGYRASNATKGAGSTITNQHGVYIADQTQGTNNYGITSLVSSGTNKWNVYASGTAQNYFAGDLSVGSTTALSPAAGRGNITINGTSSAFIALGTGGTRRAYITTDGTNMTLVSDVAGSQIFGTNGTERMRIDSAGNVGIGTSSPATQLHISGSSPIIRLSDTDGNGEYCQISGNSLSGSLSLQADEGNTASGSIIAFRVDASEKMRLDSSGNLGLGVTPSAWSSYRGLQLGGGSLMSYDTNTYIDLYQNTYDDGTGKKYVNTGYASYYRQTSGKHIWNTAPSGTAGTAITFTQAMTLDASGNLGIGTTSPAQKLDVNGNILARANVLFVANDSYIGFASNNVAINNSSDRLVFSTAASERMRIDSAGNLGLGVTPSAWGSVFKVLELPNGVALTSTPAASDLQLFCNAYYNGTAYTYKTNNYATQYEQNGGRHQWFTAPSGTAGNAITFTQAMTLDASGNLGVGTTSPTFAAGTGVQVKGSGFTSLRVTAGSYTGFDISQTNSTGDAYVYVRDNAPLIFGTNNTERMRIDSTGKVGIGTVSPAVSLAVSATDAVLVAKGTTAQRPTGVSGYLRFNTDTTSFEGYNGTAWAAVGGGNTTSYGMWENANTISANYTITTGNNAVSAGPITINTGVTVTVPTGSSWSIV